MFTIFGLTSGRSSSFGVNFIRSLLCIFFLSCLQVRSLVGQTELEVLQAILATLSDSGGKTVPDYLQDVYVWYPDPIGGPYLKVGGRNLEHIRDELVFLNQLLIKTQNLSTPDRLHFDIRADSLMDEYLDIISAYTQLGAGSAYDIFTILRDAVENSVDAIGVKMDGSLEVTQGTSPWMVEMVLGGAWEQGHDNTLNILSDILDALSGEGGGGDTTVNIEIELPEDLLKESSDVTDGSEHGDSDAVSYSASAEESLTTVIDDWGPSVSNEWDTVIADTSDDFTDYFDIENVETSFLSSFLTPFSSQISIILGAFHLTVPSPGQFILLSENAFSFPAIVGGASFPSSDIGIDFTQGPWLLVSEYGSFAFALLYWVGFGGFVVYVVKRLGGTT